MSSVVLPEDWVIARIEDIANVKGGKRLPKGDEFSDVETAHPYLRVTDFGSTTVDMSNLKYITSSTHKKIAQYTISKNDLYISIAGTIGLVGTIPQQLDGANLTENAAKLSDIQGVNKKYLVSFLNSNFAKSQFVDKTVSSGQPKLALFRIKECELFLPPLAEQNVIAEKLDELLAQVDILKTRLTTIPTLLKRFRQSVLAAAVSGKLTDIINERAFISLGNAGVTIKTGPFGSALHKADYVQDGIPVINPMHINDGKIYPSGSMTITKEKFAELSAWHLKHGDVIIGRRGEMGRAAVFDKSQKDMLCGTGSMILRGDESVLPDYLSIIVRSPVAVAYFNDGSVGTTMVNLNQSIIKELKVYFPEIEEQTEIVRRVEQLFAFADQIEQQVKNAQSRVNNLTQSILAKAFRGELTADWRSENPDLITGENSAQALLAKIKAERDKPKKTPKQQAMFTE
jgi:type I restriction enzyme S subunit